MGVKYKANYPPIMLNVRNHKIARRRVPRNRTHVRTTQLHTSTRNLTFSKELVLRNWEASGASHQRSAPIVLEFTASSFPGFSSLAQVFDQVRFDHVTWVIVQQSALGSTKTVRPRTITVLSSYDPDGGNMNSVDVLSRNNLKIRTIHAAVPETSVSGVPGTIAPDTKHLLTKQWHDCNSLSGVTFHSHQVVCDVITGDLTPGDQIVLKAYCHAQLSFKGLR